MSMLLVGDLHLTANARDAYRWKTFDTIDALLQEYKPTHLVLLGDLTDEKDRHSAELVNRIVDKLCALVADHPTHIHVLRGNHDGIDPEWPFFRFLWHMEQVHFYPSPAPMKESRMQALMLPHSRNPLVDWENVPFDKYELVFAHVTVQGATAESGVELRSDIGPEFFKERSVRVYSGDVHVPQTMRPITYVGSPHPIRFGDKFTPRIILLHALRGREEEKSIDVPSIRRHLWDISDVDDLDKRKVSPGDQAKVRLHLPQDRLGTWLPQRKLLMERCRKMGVELVAVELLRAVQDVAAAEVLRKEEAKDPRRVLDAYIEAHGVAGDCAAIGHEFLDRSR